MRRGSCCIKRDTLTTSCGSLLAPPPTSLLRPLAWSSSQACCRLAPDARALKLQRRAICDYVSISLFCNLRHTCISLYHHTPFSVLCRRRRLSLSLSLSLSLYLLSCHFPIACMAMSISCPVKGLYPCEGHVQSL